MQAWLDTISKYFSPYDFNPLNINPLKDLFERFVDFDAVRAFSDLQLFISATNVQTGRVRIFSREKITAGSLMASACLPLLFRAVEIDGVPYWDGGYLANPVIFPFFGTTDHRRRSGGADQSAGTAGDADLSQRNHKSHQRNYL